MANFPIPYLYKNPSFWGDPRDKFYGTDFVNLPYQENNEDNYTKAALANMKTYIKYIKSREIALMQEWGVLNTEQLTFSITDATKMIEPMKELEEELKNLRLNKDNVDITEYQKTSLKKIQNITASTTTKTVSKFILKNLFNPSQDDQIEIDTFLQEVLDPIESVLQKNPNAKQGKQWTYFLETQTKLLSYIIDFFNSPAIEPYKNTSWYIKYNQIIIDLDNDLKKAKLKRETKKTVGYYHNHSHDLSSNKFIIKEDTQEVTVNISSFRKSVTGSLSALSRQGYAGKIEKAVARHLKGELSGSKRSAGGTAFNFKISLPEISIKTSEEENDIQEQMIAMQKKTQQFLQDALKGQRTVKADVLWSNELGENFGISVKSGQSQRTKLDTRANYFTFINFITQYSPAIAEALVLPQNQHILINMVANLGSFNSNSLDAALNMISFAFFGAQSEESVNKLTKYFSDFSKKYSENVIIINDFGMCTRISTYLSEILTAVENYYEREKMLYSIRATFRGPVRDSFMGPPPPHPHPAEKEWLDEGINYLKDIAVETYIKTFH